MTALLGEGYNARRNAFYQRVICRSKDIPISLSFDLKRCHDGTHPTLMNFIAKQRSLSTYPELAEGLVLNLDDVDQASITAPSP
jgi:hypothetical protein